MKNKQLLFFGLLVTLMPTFTFTDISWEEIETVTEFGETETVKQRMFFSKEKFV